MTTNALIIVILLIVVGSIPLTVLAAALLVAYRKFA